MRSLNLVLLVSVVSLALAINACKKNDEEYIEEDAEVTEPDAAPAPDTKPVVKPDTKAPTPDLPPATPDTMPSYDAWKTCQIEVNLATKVPCDCFGTKVYDLAVQYPDCVSPKILKCCPAEHKPKCE